MDMHLSVWYLLSSSHPHPTPPQLLPSPPQPHQNIMDVSYHITEYHKIIAELRGKIEHLQKQLQTAQPGKTEEPPQGGCGCEERRESHKHTHTCTGPATTGEPIRTQLQAILTKEKAFLTEEKELQQEMLGVECALLQNALECQKHICAIKDWELKRNSLGSISIHKISTNSVQSPIATAGHMTSCDQATSCDDHTVLSELCISPDSVSELLGISLEPMGVPLEPMEVSSYREELATLAADKQRLETNQRRLQQKLKANRSAMIDLQQVGVVHVEVGP